MKTAGTTAASHTGVAVGSAFVIRDDGAMHEHGPSVIPFGTALEKAREELETLSSGDGPEAEIFAAHLEMCCDPMIPEQVSEMLENMPDDELGAVAAARDGICAMFEAIDDEYLHERVNDVRDVFARIIGLMQGRTRADMLKGIPEGAVVVASELAPSDTALMDMGRIAGLVTERGSLTSHVCIIARNYGIPVLTGVDGCLDAVEPGDVVIVDTDEGIVISNPSNDLMLKAMSRIQRDRSADVGALALAQKPAATTDGRTVKVMANAGSPFEVKAAIDAGADGIGLLRSEFLYMGHEAFPTEEEQFEAYRVAVSHCQGRILTIRTMDIGGDKELPYFRFPHEDNPFLGWRGIRMSLDMPEIFKVQIRAILRASAYGPVRIMFPMICSTSEFEMARSVVQECMVSLSSLGIPHAGNIPVGMMVETPAAVLMAEELASAADFFSIGTNDLTQYIMAADRGNAKVSRLYDWNSPAVRKAVETVARAGRLAGIEVGMCGEMASDKMSTEFLVNCGLEELSVNISSVAGIKDRIRHI